MLKAETIKQLESLLNISNLSDAISSTEEVEITVPTGILYTEEEISTLKNNEYKSGKEKGVEMAVKEVKEKQGLDFQGKTVDGLLDAFKKKVLDDAKIEPAEKVKELEGKLTTLQKTVGEYEQQLSAKDSEVASVKINTELYKYIPQFGENAPALDQDDIIEMMRRKGLEFKLEGGKVVAYKDGQKQTEKLSNDLPVKDVVTGFLKERKLIVEEQTPGGRGGSDKKPATMPGSISELKESFQKQGKSLLGNEFAQAVEQAKKADPEFRME